MSHHSIFDHAHLHLTFTPNTMFMTQQHIIIVHTPTSHLSCHQPSSSDADAARHLHASHSTHGQFNQPHRHSQFKADHHRLSLGVTCRFHRFLSFVSWLDDFLRVLGFGLHASRQHIFTTTHLHDNIAVHGQRDKDRNVCDCDSCFGASGQIFDGST